MDNGLMCRIYWNQTAAAYSSLYFFIFFFSPIFIHLHFRRTFLRNCWAYKVNTWYTRGQWLDVLCVPKSDCCCLFIPLCNFSFQFSNIKIFVTLFSGTMRPTKLRLVTRVLCIPKSGCCCLFVPLFFHFSFQFSNIKSFSSHFYQELRAFKVETRYTCRKWVDVACILESDCCCFFISPFFFLSNFIFLLFPVSPISKD